jgi:hypothetical protein
VLIYLQTLRQSYEYSTIVSYFNDLKNLQKKYSRGISMQAHNHTFSRCKMLLKVFRKELPRLSEKKRPWQAKYFHHVVKGMQWESAWPQAPFEQRVVWTIMVFMFEHLLRLGEVVGTHVPTQTARRPWTWSSVTFWAGSREIKWEANGAPLAADKYNCTHAVVECTPSKTDAEGCNFEPFVCPIPSELELLNSSDGSFHTASNAKFFATGALLWDMMTRNPVKRLWAPVVPLFRAAPCTPPTLCKQIQQNAFVKMFNLFCKDASPPIPVSLDGKKLGGHCMRVAGCNHAASQNASIVQIANKGRWGAWAFATNCMYDYARTDAGGIQRLTTTMILALACLPVAHGQPDYSIHLTWDTAQLLVLVCCGIGVWMTLLGHTFVQLVWGAVFADHTTTIPMAETVVIDADGENRALRGFRPADQPLLDANVPQSVGTEPVPTLLPSAPPCLSLADAWKVCDDLRRAQDLAERHAYYVALMERRPREGVQRRLLTHRSVCKRSGLGVAR